MGRAVRVAAMLLLAWGRILPACANADDADSAFGRRQGAHIALHETVVAEAARKAAMTTAGTSVAADARNRSVTLRGWIKDAAYKSLPPRWHGHGLTTLDLDAPLPRPFDAAFDARWVPWLHRGKLTKVKRVRKSKYDVGLHARDCRR